MTPRYTTPPDRLSDKALVTRLRELLETKVALETALHACLQVAIVRGYATRNPVRLLEPAQRPRANKRKASYFTDVELARLWTELPTVAPLDVYHYLCKAAVTTGARLGELLALEWPDVRFLERELGIARGYTQGIGIDTPKDNEERTVDLTPAAESVLQDWFQLSGCPDSGLVFPNAGGGYLVGTTVTRAILYPAMERAGIPRVGERGWKRDFHSFRHSFAKIALEHGAEMTWVQRQLGHSSITVTVDRYGDWERRAEKVQAARLKDAFPIAEAAAVRQSVRT
jgi:integrase